MGRDGVAVSQQLLGHGPAFFLSHDLQLPQGFHQYFFDQGPIVVQGLRGGAGFRDDTG